MKTPPLAIVLLICLSGCRTTAEQAKVLDADSLDAAVIQCQRTDALNRDFLEGATHAGIYKRTRSYDSRVRFFNKDKNYEQVDTCSVMASDNKKYSCEGAGGPQGNDVELRMLLEVDSEESYGYLHFYNKPFRLKVQSPTTAAGANWLVFECVRILISD